MLTLPRSRGWLAVVGVVLAIIGFASWWLGVPSPTISVLSAHLQVREGGPSLGFAKMPKEDILSIVDREFYIRAKIFSCTKEGDFYPIDLVYDGTAMDDFRALSKKLDGYAGKDIDLSFSVPSAITDRYADRCLRVYGGQMMGAGRVTSNLVKIR